MNETHRRQTASCINPLALNRRWAHRQRLILLIGVSLLVGGNASGSDLVQEGKGTYDAFCVACHQADATGKVGFAPNIRNKDFLAIASDDFLRQSIKQGRPGTAMVPWSFLTDAQIDGLIAYLRSGNDALMIEPIAIDPRKRYPGDAVAGEGLYNTYCASCHGEKGAGYATGRPGPAIGGKGFLSVASDDFIYKTLENGRVGTAMKPFIGPEALANLSAEEAGSIIAYLRSLSGDTPAIAAAPKPSGDPVAGEAAYNINCMACHQPGGVGKPGFAPSIRNQDFLAIASDAFIKETVSKGRPGTSMIGRPDLSDTVINDIIAYLRAVPMDTAKHVAVDDSLKFHGDVAAGESKYANFCASCHGGNGEGYMAGLAGSAIGMKGFLSVASDDYILQTVKRGRVGTAMKPFVGAKGVANLSEEDVHDIIVYLRNKVN